VNPAFRDAEWSMLHRHNGVAHRERDFHYPERSPQVLDFAHL
jgi:hypothetical protein